MLEPKKFVFDGSMFVDFCIILEENPHDIVGTAHYLPTSCVSNASMYFGRDMPMLANANANVVCKR